MASGTGDGRFFFFSSRRRHTRCSRDWSSDVCSSDLIRFRTPTWPGSSSGVWSARQATGAPHFGQCGGEVLHRRGDQREIGRASCGGRGEISVGGGSLKKKKKNIKRARSQ